MPNLITKLTSPHWLGLTGMALFVGCGIGFVAHHASADSLVNDNNVAIGRDFLAFYLAGQIVANGQGQNLYDGAEQQRTQDAVLAPAELDGLAYYINPAPVAVVFSLLTRLPYLWAFYLHTALMLILFLLAMRCLKPHLPSLAPHWFVAVLLGATWFPMMHTIMGGQNAALTFFLLVVAYSSATKGKQWVAGAALGLLLFKPQYALPLLGLLLLRRQFRTCAVATVIGAGQYALGALFCGWDWLAKMVGSMGEFYREQERLVSGPTHISLTEVLDYSIVRPLESFGGYEVLAQCANLLGYVLVGVIVLHLIWSWRRADPRRADFGLYWAQITSAMLLISLHTQYYECALLVLPILLILEHLARSGLAIGPRPRLLLVVAFLAFWPLYSLPEWFGWFRFQPVALMPLVVGWWALRTLKGAASFAPQGLSHPEEDLLVVDWRASS